MMQFINIHQHSHHSLDGAATVMQILTRNKELGATHVALTEHGNLNSAMELYVLAPKLNLKPILGIEVYLEAPFKEHLRTIWEQTIEAPTPAQKERKIERKLKEAYVHLTIHFKDAWAYQYFCILTPQMDARAVVRYGERKPLITWEELAKAAGHITIGTGCLQGPVSALITPKNGKNYPELAEAMYVKLRTLVGPENVFVELLPHRINTDWRAPVINDDGKVVKPGFHEPIPSTDLLPNGDLQEICNRFMLSMARKYNDRVVISLDSHYAYAAQSVIQNARLGKGTGQWQVNGSYHIMSTDEAAAVLKETLGVNDDEIAQWVQNSYEFAKLFDDFKIDTQDDRWVLEALPHDALQKLNALITKYGRMDWNNAAMVTRLQQEIRVLCYNNTVNLLPYFFTLEHMAHFCYENDILMTVRGSAAGSLLLYLIGVCPINPLKHDLSFERFLTEGRIKAKTLPDCDIDVSTGGRELLLTHMKEHYGDRFCQLSIDSMLKLRSSIKDAERFILNGKVRPTTEALCKTLPQEPQGVKSSDILYGYVDSLGHAHPGIIDTHKQFQEYIQKNPKIWEIIRELIGIQRQKSVHACGVVIADKPVQTYCPIISIKGTRVTGFAPKSIEYAGLVKYDILGLNTLFDIQRCLQSIKERTGENIDPWNLPEDEKVFEQFCLANTETVFQFDTATVKPYLMEILPRNIEELAMITALCRPGTLDALAEDGRTLAKVFVARRQGEIVRYIHPDLESILGPTLGIALYQESTLRIFRDLGAMSHEQAEEVRRGIGKKDEQVLAAAAYQLRQTCVARGWTDSQAQLLFEQIMASAKYAFNKSHAISYSYIAYACMYLKTYYPMDWWKAILSNASQDDIATKFWKFIRHFIIMPDINNVTSEFKIVGDKLQAPLSIINGIGEKAYQSIVQNAPYRDLAHFLTIHLSSSRMRAASKSSQARSAVHSGIVRKLIIAGVMDNLFPPEDQILEQKLHRFEQLRAELLQTTPQPVPPEYIGMTDLGRYMVKKSLISVYSRDLRPLMLPTRGGRQQNGHWLLQDNKPVVTASQLQHARDRAEQHLWTHGEFYCLGYVISEKIITYQNKTRRATKMLVDIDGEFVEEILWPPRDEATADSGFQGQPVLLMFWSSPSRVGLKRVIKLLPVMKEKCYNMV